MIRLTKVELRRLAARRLVLALVLGAVVGTGLMLWGTWTSVQPMTAQETEQAERFFAEASADWEENGERYLADCLEQQEIESEATGEQIDFGCDQMTAPERQWYFPTAPPLHESFPRLVATVAYLVVFVALFAGATSTAAEFSTGAIGNWLTFEPRRLHVYGSKIAAAGAGLLPVAALVVGVVAAGVWWFHDLQGLADGMTPAVWSDVAWVGVRIVVLAVAMAVVGAALGFVLRHTAAVLGLVVAYAIVVEAMLAGALPGLQPWKVLNNVDAWVRDGTTYVTYGCRADAGGTVCDMTEHTLALGHGAAYLAAATLAVVVLGGVLFRHRDVT